MCQVLTHDTENEDTAGYDPEVRPSCGLDPSHCRIRELPLFESHRYCSCSYLRVWNRASLHAGGFLFSSPRNGTYTKHPENAAV